MQQRDEGLVQKNLFAEADGYAADCCFLQSKGWFCKPAGGALKEFKRGAHGAGGAGGTPRVDWVLPEIQTHIRRRTPRHEGGVVHLIEVIKHSECVPSAADDQIMLQCNLTTP